MGWFKKTAKSVKKVASSVESEVRRTGRKIDSEVSGTLKSVGDELLRNPADYMTLGLTALAKEGLKGVADIMAPDVNIDTGAGDLLKEQQTRAENANADLSLNNVADIVGGGTASSLGGVGRRKKNKGGRGPATSLGINA